MPYKPAVGKNSNPGKAPQPQANGASRNPESAFSHRTTTITGNRWTYMSIDGVDDGRCRSAQSSEHCSQLGDGGERVLGCPYDVPQLLHDRRSPQHLQQGRHGQQEHAPGLQAKYFNLPVGEVGGEEGVGHDAGGRGCSSTNQVRPQLRVHFPASRSLY